MSNKVKYGLCNCYYATVTENEASGKVTETYGTPVKWPGAVSLSLDAEGDTNKFKADNGDYYVSIANNGYSGDFESALVPESFKTDIMGDTKNATTGPVTEKNTQKPKAFAFLFQFEGDESATRYVLYNCKMTRPSIESETTDDSIEPKTETGEITASPRTSDGVIRGYCADEDATCYSNWFTSVQAPSA